MTETAHTLLDVTDTHKRLVQHGTVLVAIALLLAAQAAVASRGLTITLVLIAVALALFVVASITDQRWAVEYRGHRILFQNNPFRGEKLFVDDALVAKGKLGVTSEMRTRIASGEGSGDEIVARSTAGLIRFRCQIQVVPASAIQASDEQLLAEIRRRGLL
jgi:hypothetical protein